MSFECEGWLGEDAKVLGRQCEKQFGPNLAVARRTNVLAHKVVRELEVSAHNPQHLLAKGLFVRLLQSTQASTHLILLGLPHDAAVIIRTSIETLIILVNVCKDPTFGRRYVSEGSRKTLLRTDRGLPEAAREELDTEMRSRLEAAETQHRKVLENLGKRLGSLEELAATAGLSPLYNTAYRLYSAAVHSEAGTVASYYEGQPGAMVMNYAPDWQYTGVYLLSICDVLLRGIESLEQLFGSSYREARELIAQELNELSPQWPDPKQKSV